MNEINQELKVLGLNVIFQHFYRSMNEDTLSGVFFLK